MTQFYRLTRFLNRGTLVWLTREKTELNHLHALAKQGRQVLLATLRLRRGRDPSLLGLSTTVITPPLVCNLQPANSGEKTALRGYGGCVEPPPGDGGSKSCEAKADLGRVRPTFSLFKTRILTIRCQHCTELSPSCARLNFYVFTVMTLPGGSSSSGDADCSLLMQSAIGTLIRKP